jgi:hypothetical protein
MSTLWKSRLEVSIRPQRTKAQGPGPVRENQEEAVHQSYGVHDVFSLEFQLGSESDDDGASPLASYVVVELDYRLYQQ